MAKEELFLDITDKNTALRTAKNARVADKATLSLLKSAKLLAAAYVAIKAIKIGAELAQQATQAQRADKALAAYIGSMGKATRATKAMQEALGGTVSEFEATQLATKLIALGLADTGEGAAALAKDIATLGSVFGKESTPAIEEFTLLMANLSKQRLDTFGIAASSVTARMKVLRAETKGLTNEQAFQAATMEQLTAKAALVGDVFDDDAAVYDKLRSTSSDLAEVVGEKLSGAFSVVAEKAIAAEEAMISALTLGDVRDDPLAEAVRQGEILILTYEALEKRSDGFLNINKEINSILLDLKEQEILANQERQNALFFAQEGTDVAFDLVQFRRAELEIAFQLLTPLQQELHLANQILKVDERIAEAKKDAIKATIEQTILGRGSVKQAVSDAIRGEAAKATAAFIANSFSSLPLPLAIIASAGAGALIGGLFDSVIPSFAHGGDFTTNGPQLIQVGDNTSGRERVTVTPDPAPGQGAHGITLIVQGDIVGTPDAWVENVLNPALDRVNG